MATRTAPADSNRPRLTTIPLELLLQITSNLTTPEYGNLRLTCKQLEETVFTSFAREFFTKRQFMFTEFSLQALVDISKSRLSSCLNHVIFGLERPSLRHHIQMPFGANPQLQTMLLKTKSNRSRQEYVDHMSLLSTGQDVEMLAEAFSNLSNLETVGIRDFYSRSRYRDYPNIEWKSYGVSTFELETGSRLDVPQRRFNPSATFSAELQDEAKHLSRVFINVLRAIGKAGSRPRHYEVILRQSSLHDHAFNLPKYVGPLVQPVLDNLRTLLLDLNADFPPVHVDVKDMPTECHNFLLRTFLSRLPELEHLRLNFRFYHDQETSNLLSWLSSPVSAATSNSASATSLLESPQPIEFTKLQRLDIGIIKVEPQVLFDIIRKHRATLRIISFHKVTLLPINPTKPGDNLWAKFFGQLLKLDLKLTCVNMSFLAQEQVGKHPLRPITFKDSGNFHSRNWGGTDVQSCLRDYIANVVVEGPDHDTDSSHSGESEVDSDDSMDDIDDDDDDDEDEDEDASH